jgi:hypothetical protein
VNGAPFFHVGILVADLHEAIERFSQKLGLSFCEPSQMTVTLEHGPAHEGATRAECELRATYSRQGPPYIELIQGEGDGLFSLAHGEGMHHLGLWAPGWDEFGRLEPSRCLAVATQVHQVPGGPQMWVSDPVDLCGTRIEYVDSTMQPVLEAWIES